MTPSEDHHGGDHDRAARAGVAGFTLIEMLLVLAILVAITAVTIPVVGRMYDTRRIHQAAVEVRTAFSAARLRAVDQGESVECRFEPDGRHLVILATQERGIRFGDEDDASSATSRRSRQAMHVALPEPLLFWTASLVRERIDADALRGLEGGAIFGDRNWSAPVVFAPDGSSTSAEFEIRDPSGRAVRMVVRGLTGAASSSSLIKRSDP